MRDWRFWGVVAVVLAQFALPAVQLFGKPPPQRFGFQMYSGYGGVDVQLRDAEGEPLPVEWRGEILPYGMRAELDWTQHLPERLCGDVPDLASIEIRVKGREPVVISCSG